MKQNSTKIYEENIILVEGSGDQKLVENLLNKNELGGKFNINKLGGILNLNAELDLVLTQLKSSQKIKSLLIIVDADDSFQSRGEEIISSLEKAGFSIPNGYEFGEIIILDELNIKFGVFILPNNKENGSLETLLIEAIKPDKSKLCVNQLIECQQEAKAINQSITENQKAKLQFRLLINSLMINYDFSYDKTIAEMINFEHHCFNSLKGFLSKITSEPI